MKKTLWLVIALPQAIAAMQVQKVADVNNNKQNQFVIVPIDSELGKRIEKEMKRTDVVPMLIGDIRSEYGRIAFNKNQSLVHVMADTLALAKDPTLSAIFASAKIYASPVSPEIVSLIVSNEANIEQHPGNILVQMQHHAKEQEKMVALGKKVKGYADSIFVPKTYTVELVETNPEFLERPVVVGIATANTKEKAGISAQSLLPHAYGESKATTPDILVVRNETTTEVAFTPAGENFMPVIAEKMMRQGVNLKKGFLPGSQNYLEYNNKTVSDKVLTSQDFYNLISEAVAYAEEWVLNEKTVA